VLEISLVWLHIVAAEGEPDILMMKRPRPRNYYKVVDFTKLHTSLVCFVDDCFGEGACDGVLHRANFELVARSRSQVVEDDVGGFDDHRQRPSRGRSAALRGVATDGTTGSRYHQRTVVYIVVA